MKVAVIGSGIIGLTLARALLNRHPNCQLDLVDKFSVPSSGTSIRNSGVLHAGLYYRPDSLKAQLCKKGTLLLEQFISTHSLPLLSCGKLLIPHLAKDYSNLKKIKDTADANGCTTELINHSAAQKIQPGLVGRDIYLWSPKTKVFSPSHILRTLVSELKSYKVNYVIDEVLKIDSKNKSIYCKKAMLSGYDFIFNVSGPGSLDLYQNDAQRALNLKLLPILGQYAVLKNGPEIFTNLYPVPDPELPFLGVHITPRPGMNPIIGPNALPILKSYMQAKETFEFKDLATRLGIMTSMYITNQSNFRVHANSEFSLSVTKKFFSNTIRYFSQMDSSFFDIAMDDTTYGIRPQLVDARDLSFFEDFICDKYYSTLHVVNAVSPAFTSSFALAEYLLDRMDAT